MNRPDGLPVILVTTVRGFGTTVRWFRDIWSAERNHAVLSVTPHGISTHGGYLNEMPDEWLTAARSAYEELSLDKFADLTRLATHINSVVSNGLLVPVTGDSRG